MLYKSREISEQNFQCSMIFEDGRAKLECQSPLTKRVLVLVASRLVEPCGLRIIFTAVRQRFERVPVHCRWIQNLLQPITTINGENVFNKNVDIELESFVPDPDSSKGMKAKGRKMLGHVKCNGRSARNRKRQRETRDTFQLPAE